MNSNDRVIALWYATAREKGGPNGTLIQLMTGAEGDGVGFTPPQEIFVTKEDVRRLYEEWVKEPEEAQG